MSGFAALSPTCETGTSQNAFITALCTVAGRNRVAAHNCGAFDDGVGIVTAILRLRFVLARARWLCVYFAPLETP
jgi:hypothetical protein